MNRRSRRGRDEGTALTWILGDEHGGAAKVAGPAGSPSPLPVAVEGVGGVGDDRIRLEAGPAGEDGVAVST